MTEFSIYFHIPFCKSKCRYCGFASMAGGEALFTDYARAATNELDRRMNGVFSGTPFTVYIGGGTPSSYPAGLLFEIVGRIIPGAVEVTVEANPESATDEWLAAMLEMGANRISIGVQALDDRLLETLGRIHTADRALQAVERAHRAGFKRISVDLMFGIPGQTMDAWTRTLERVSALPVDHVSCYSLSLEEDTPFLARFLNDRTMLPSPETTVEMYRLLVEMLGGKGILGYELSNFSLPGRECQHNMGYWSFRPYLGIGAGAHSFDGSKRTWNHADPETYIESHTTGNGRPAGEEIVDERSRALETLMLSLRTRTGLDVVSYSRKYAVNPAVFVKLAGEYVQAGFMEEWSGGYVRIAAGGVMMADEIISDLAAECME